MGAETFDDYVKGYSANQAFKAAVEQASYDYGHGGYTGSIAEKGSFEIIKEHKPANKEEAYRVARKLIDERDGRIDDKWGPAGCLVIKEPVLSKPMGKAKAQTLAKKLYGETAEVTVKVAERASKANGGKRRVVATITVVQDKQDYGLNTSVPGGKWKVTKIHVEGENEKEACGRLFDQQGEYLFFGWASS